MRILVLSDSHRDTAGAMAAVRAQRRAEVILHLGDGADDIDAAKLERPDVMFLNVRGNCDFASLLPYEITQTFDSVKIFMTHGYYYNVKEDLCLLEEKARREGAQIALYGHTHIPKIEYRDGLYLMCPGSVSGYNATYGTIDITPQGIVCNMVKMK